MISLDLRNINKNIINDSISTRIDDVKKNIESIKDFSEILEVCSITLLDDSLGEPYDILCLIKLYENYVNSGQFDNLKCPLCKDDNFSYHKSYYRDFTFQLGQYLIESKISLAVVECNNCKHKKDT